MTDFSKYVVYKPGARVKSGRSTIYFSYGQQALYAAYDTYLTKTTWINEFTWDNTTDDPQTYTHEYSTGLTVTQGTEVTNSVNVGGAFEGLSLTMDELTKTFATYETSTSSQPRTLSVTVAARGKLTFYQRAYEFRMPMFFILDTSGREWNVGSPGGHYIVRKECTVQIVSDDYLTTHTTPSPVAEGTMIVTSVARATNEADRQTQMREDLTNRAKAELAKMGV